MPAVPVHHTDTVDKPWDGPGNVAKLRSGESRAYYRRMFAWEAPEDEADPTTKSAYKLPHHEVDSDGEPGPANVRGCIAAIAALNGARGGVDIPDRDRKPTWRHVAAHLEDADMEPAELRRLIVPEREVRRAELRIAQVEESEEEMIVEGRAIVYNSPAVIAEFDGQKYYEVILPGALDGADMRDVPFKYNHSDHVMVMARTRNKTLELIPDDKGLFIRARLANITAGRDLYKLVKRGDVDKMSFTFTVAEDSYDVESRTRKIRRFKRIWDVSAVDTPAYEDTYIAARNYLLEHEAINQVFEWLEREKARRRRKLYLMTFV
ncbi:MAG: HK97 family phage prohead protease [Marinobacterium sp.]